MENRPTFLAMSSLEQRTVLVRIVPTTG